MSRACIENPNKSVPQPTFQGNEAKLYFPINFFYFKGKNLSIIQEIK